MPEFPPVPAPRGASAPVPRAGRSPSVRGHRTRGSELAALAFAPPQAIPAPRSPSERPAG